MAKNYQNEINKTLCKYISKLINPKFRIYASVKWGIVGSDRFFLPVWLLNQCWLIFLLDSREQISGEFESEFCNFNSMAAILSRRRWVQILFLIFSFQTSNSTIKMHRASVHQILHFDMIIGIWLGHGCLTTVNNLLWNVVKYPYLHWSLNKPPLKLGLRYRIWHCDWGQSESTNVVEVSPSLAANPKT